MSAEDLDNARKCALKCMESVGFNSSVRMAYGLNAIAWALIAAADPKDEPVVIRHLPRIYDEEAE